MEAILENNRAAISGHVHEPPTFSHTLYGEAFYRFLLCVPRLSGVEDILPVTVSERLIAHMPAVGDAMQVTGQLRSYNIQSDGNNRLLITVFARSIEEKRDGDQYINEILLNGYLCKPPVYRTTPFSREITDVLLAVNRPYHKSDYLPVIIWGRNARFVSALTVGDKLGITGRMQSRPYQKTLPDGNIISRIAYEVSAATVEYGDSARSFFSEDSNT